MELALPYISDLSLPSSPNRNLRSADQHLLAVPMTSCASFEDRALVKTAPTCTVERFTAENEILPIREPF